MNIRRILILLMVLLIVVLARPRGVWNESRQLWGQRNRILRVLVVTVVVYFLYGLFQLYRQGWVW